MNYKKQDLNANTLNESKNDSNIENEKLSRTFAAKSGDDVEDLFIACFNELTSGTQDNIVEEVARRKMPKEKNISLVVQAEEVDGYFKLPL